jgi:hypothetical protein
MQQGMKLSSIFSSGMLLLCLAGCPLNDDPLDEDCVITGWLSPDSSSTLGCENDFSILASEPLDASIPGATSVKTVIDLADEGALYFMNTKRYPYHWIYAFTHLSGGGRPFVSFLPEFNATEYQSPERRFLLGAITRYDDPGVWAYELAAFDSASADQIESAFVILKEKVFFGEELYFHPTSAPIQLEATKLPDTVPVISNQALFADIPYQALNLGASMGQLAFYTDADLDDQIPYFREIVVLDTVPNEISVVMGIITNDFQTPLSHINVLSQNRGTPNMALVGSFTDSTLRALEGKWVELTVNAMDYSIREVTMEEANAWWEAHRPEPIDVGAMDLSVTEITDETTILDLENIDLADALDAAIPVFGGKASHYGGLAQLGDEVPHPIAFAIPAYYYHQFMTDNGFWPVVDEMLASPDFQSDAQTRRDMLKTLRDQMKAATVNVEFIAAVESKILDGYASGLYPQTRFRFRSSTNAEDISGFNGAGLYTSKSGDPNDPDDPVDEAVKKVWASLWSARAYEERAYYSIEHRNIGMALLCHRSFPDENANGVAITNNVYDTSGLEPAFYINVQDGEESVVFPEAGMTTDQIIYYYDLSDQPAVYIQHSNLIPEGQTVLTDSQLDELGGALRAVHDYFQPVYGNTDGFYAMDTEFKFDENPVTGQVQVYLKQARPYPGWNQP